MIEVEAVASSNGRLALTYQGEETAIIVEESQLHDVGIQNDTAIENGATAPEMPASRERKALAAVAHPLSLRQKLAEVRRRIGQIEKRGINQEGNYKYVRAADLAGAVGDVLADLGVILLPRLESISTEPLGNRTGAEHLTRVIIAYTFMDANSAEELTVKVAGEGVDPGDKSVCKAQTSALKYALLQSFLIATGDDPEEDGVNATDRDQVHRTSGAERITPTEVQEDRRTDRADRHRARSRAGILRNRIARRDDRAKLSQGDKLPAPQTCEVQRTSRPGRLNIGSI